MIERHPTLPNELHPLRAHDVTSSRFAALIGADPFMTAGQVFAELQGINFGVKETGPMKRGRALEPVAAAMLAEQRPDLVIRKANEYIRDPDLRLGASPDYYARTQDGKRLCIEFKTIGKRRFDRVWVDSPPPNNTLQTAVAMMLDDADAGLLAVLVFDEYSAFDLHTFDVPRHHSAEQRIRDVVTSFWKNFDAGIPPKIDYERDGALIALMYPTEIAGKIIDLRSDNRMPELCAENERLAAEIKEREAARTVVQNEMKMKMGDAESALVNGWRVTFKLQTRKAHQVKESSFRVLKAKPEERAA